MEVGRAKALVFFFFFWVICEDGVFSWGGDRTLGGIVVTPGIFLLFLLSLFVRRLWERVEAF